MEHKEVALLIETDEKCTKKRSTFDRGTLMDSSY